MNAREFQDETFLRSGESGSARNPEWDRLLEGMLRRPPRGRLQRFLESFGRILLQEERDSPGYHSWSGKMCYYSHDFEGAARMFGRAIEAGHDAELCRINRSRSLLQLGDVAGAQADSEWLMESRPEAPFGYFLQADVELRRGNPEIAIFLYSQALTIYPFFHDVFNSRGCAYLAQGRNNSAIEDFLDAISRKPDPAPWYNMSLGHLARKAGNEEAICCNRAALLLDEDDPHLWFQMGGLYETWETLRPEISESRDEIFRGCLPPESQFWVDLVAHKNRRAIAERAYSKAFTLSLPDLRTDLGEIGGDEASMFLFVGEEFALSPLLKQSFHFSDAHTFADCLERDTADGFQNGRESPGDCPILRDESLKKLLVRAGLGSMRIRCLSRIDVPEMRANALMWEAHASQHAGIAYQLAISKKWLSENEIYSGRVDYVTEMPPEIRDMSPEQVIRSGLYVKNRSYAYEKEWRLIKFGEFEAGEGVDVSWNGEDGTPGVRIVSVFVGAQAPESLLSSVRDAVSELSYLVGVYRMEKTGLVLRERPVPA